MPFWPGGFEDESIELPNGKVPQEHLKGLKTVPPGFERGLRLAGDPIEVEDLVSIEEDLGGADDAENEVRLYGRNITLFDQSFARRPKLRRKTNILRTH